MNCEPMSASEYPSVGEAAATVIVETNCSVVACAAITDANSTAIQIEPCIVKSIHTIRFESVRRTRNRVEAGASLYARKPWAALYCGLAERIKTA
jgi:hypothetical protein